MLYIFLHYHQSNKLQALRFTGIIIDVLMDINDRENWGKMKKRKKSINEYFMMEVML